MSVDVAKDKPPDDKETHLSQNEEETSGKISESVSNTTTPADVIRTDDSFIDSISPNSDKKCGEESNDKDGNSDISDASKPAAGINGDSDAVAVAIEKRKQPLMELAYSEESYVRRLRVVYELYMPAPYRSPPPADAGTPVVSAVSPALPVSTSGFEELASKLPPGGPMVPEDLVARWRILWGNWMQLFEWHTGFYEKLKALLDEDPDRIPKLFIDSRARLRSIYSKYCENQIKAAHIAEKHKEFFDEWRIFVGDKEDVVSLLMQPVQRIMRYQLPISEIVKWTERAKIPSLPLWQKALDIMKEIPKDTQLILEAARIDGFPGVITALGTLRIRGDLLVASLSRSELADALRSYAKSLNILPSNPASRNSSGLSLLNKIHLQSSTTPEGGGEDKEETTPTTTITNNPATSEAASTNTTSTANAPSPEPSSPAPNLPQSTNSGVPLPPPQMSRSSLEVGEAFAPPPPPVLPGGQKFVVSRLFLFDRMLLVTEEVKAKRKGTSADAFAQSTYQFRAAVNVNKMKFEPHWFMCSLTSESAPIGPAGPGTGETPTPAPGTPAAFAAAVSAGGPGSSATESTDDQCAGSDWAAVRAALDFAASDDLRFALWDQTPGRDVIYIIDPQTVATRSAWVVHLRDIQRMQQQLLMALEDPTRFAAAEKEWGSPPALTTELPALRSQVSREQGDSQKPSSGTTNTNTGTRKWPSFTMRRPGRLSSTSSASASGTASTSSSTHGARSTTSKSKLTTTPCSPAQDGIGSSSLLRSFSAERHRIAVVTTPTTPTCKVDPATPTNTGSPQKPFVMRSSSSPYRKASVRPDGGGFGHPDRIDSVESSSGDPHRNSMRLQKTKKVFSNFFFGKHSKKGRGSGGSSNTSHHPLPPSQISLPPASVQQASLSTNPRIDSLPPPHPAPMADISSECSS